MSEINRFVLALDVGTTGVRASIYNKAAAKVILRYRRLESDTNASAHLETDPIKLYDECVAVMKDAIHDAGLTPSQIASIGIAVQRNAFTSWDKQTGRPLHPFISWADVRSAEICNQANNSLLTRGLRHVCYLLYLVTGSPRFLTFRNFTWKTSLLASKLPWVWQNVPELHEVHKRDNLLVGTIDAWLLWKLTGGNSFAMDFSNASATGLYDSYVLSWSYMMKGLLYPHKIPPFRVLPTVKDTMCDFGVISRDVLGAEIPICGMAADQEAALCGHCCFSPGEAKVTLGTGCFVTINTGKPGASDGGLYPVIAWKCPNEPPVYAMEGLEHTAGTAMDWLQRLGLVDSIEELAIAANSVSSSEGVYFVPAFYGLGPPYWDPQARGLFIGITAHTNRNHLIRAALESLAFRVAEITNLMQKDLKKLVPPMTRIRADGGVARNDFICQAIADLSGLEVERPVDLDMTSLGAAFFAGVQCGFWKSLEELKPLYRVDKVFKPQISVEERNTRLMSWHKAATRSQFWEADRSGPWLKTSFSIIAVTLIFLLFTLIYQLL